MNPIVVKVAPKGEGKTKWLLNIAKKYLQDDIPVYFVTSNEREYVNFCRKYFVMFSQACRVRFYETGDALEGAIVLIDDVMHQNIDSDVITSIQKSCHKMFVTFEGVCYDNLNESEELNVSELFEQIKFC